MNIKNVKPGMRVWWNDPDDGICSGYGEVCSVQHEESDAIISLKMDDLAEVECFAHELEYDVDSRLSDQ